MIAAIAWIPRPVRFVVIGCWNTLFSYLVYIALHRLFRLSGDPNATGWAPVALSFLAVALSYCVAIPIAFLAYKFLVFETRGNYRVEFGRFLVSNAVVPLVNLILYEPMVLLAPLGPLVTLGVWITRPLGLDHLVDRETVGQGLLQVLLAVASWLLYRYYSFRPSPS